MKRFRILIIAPYLSFQETAAPVIQEFPTVDFEMHTGDEFTAISIFNDSSAVYLCAGGGSGCILIGYPAGY